MSQVKYYDTGSGQWLNAIIGAQGAQGTTGIQGPYGFQGIQGAQGPQGTTGTQGAQGIQGIQGLQGTQGIQGVQGTQGLQGTIGVQGFTGVQGIVFGSTPPANQGVLWVNTSASSSSIQGTQGLQGSQGLQGPLPSAPLTLAYSATSTDPLTITSANGHGGSNYAGLMTLQNTNSGATNNTKSIRMNSTGGLEIINSAYSSTIFAVSDSGNVNISGTYNGVTLSDSGWNSVSLTNGFSATSPAPAYRLLNGVVFLRGGVTGGTGNTSAFTLPSGYRPAVNSVIATQQYGTSNDTYITVNTDGTVVPNTSASWLFVSFPIG